MYLIIIFLNTPVISSVCFEIIIIIFFVYLLHLYIIPVFVTSIVVFLDQHHGM